jgi:site-specific DNA recombinase
LAQTALQLHRRAGTLVPRPSERQVAVRIFTEFAAGRSQAAIVRGLLADGVRSRKGRWHQGTLSAILGNPAYIGKVRRRSDGAIADGQHEPLVSHDLWARVQERLDAAARTGSERGRPPSGPFLFRKGMLRCGACGEAMVPRTNPNRRKAPSQVYYCYGRKQCGPAFCRTPPIRRDVVDTAVYRYFEYVGLDIEATRTQIAEKMRLKSAELRALRADSERQAV